MFNINFCWLHIQRWRSSFKLDIKQVCLCYSLYELVLALNPVGSGPLITINNIIVTNYHHKQNLSLFLLVLLASSFFHASFAVRNMRVRLYCFMFKFQGDTRLLWILMSWYDFELLFTYTTMININVVLSFVFTGYARTTLRLSWTSSV